HDWVSNRMNTARPILVLTISALIAIGSIIGGLWYRVAEVPMHGDPFDVAAFEKSLPKPEANEAREKISAVLRDLPPSFGILVGLDPPQQVTNESLVSTREAHSRLI